MISQPIPLNSSILKKRWLLPAKILVVAGTFFLLYHTVYTSSDTFLHWAGILSHAFYHPLRLLFILAILLIPLNWGLEARKWQLLGQKIEPVSFGQAYRAVVVGLTLGLITPNRLGDYAGRVLELRSAKRLEAIGAVFIGRICQLAATVLAGTLGLSYFILRFYFYTYPGLSVSVFLLLLFSSVALLLLLYRAQAIVGWVAAVRPLRQLLPYMAVMGTYTSAEISKLLLLSVGRYMVFLLQFIFLLVLFGVNLSPLAYVCGVAGTFYLKSVVPSISLLSDLGVRELSAMYLFGLLGQAPLQVLSASLCLWLLNMAMPAAIGLLFVLRLRLIRKGAAA